MRKIYIMSIITVLIFLIYNIFSNQKINCLSMGDSLIKGVNPYNIEGYGYNDYLKNYLERNNILGSLNDFYYNNTIIGLTNDIKNNRTIVFNEKEYFLKKELRENNVIIISIGMDELSINYDINDMNKNYHYFDIMYANIDSLLKETRKYAINRVIFIGYHNPKTIYTSEVDELFFYMKDKLNNLANKYNVIYVDIYEDIKFGKNMNDNNYHLNTKGYLKIANKITKYLDSY